MITWRLVPTEEVGQWWSTAAAYLAKAVDRDEGRRTLHDILRSLVNGQSALWLVRAPDEPHPNGEWTYIGMTIGVVVTAIHHYPHCRTMKVEWLAGERFEEWAHLISEIEAHAKEYECASVEIGGRVGLARVMKQYGYTVTGFEGRKLI